MARGLCSIMVPSRGGPRRHSAFLRGTTFFVSGCSGCRVSAAASPVKGFCVMGFSCQWKRSPVSWAPCIWRKQYWATFFVFGKVTFSHLECWKFECWVRSHNYSIPPLPRHSNSYWWSRMFCYSANQELPEILLELTSWIWEIAGVSREPVQSTL